MSIVIKENTIVPDTTSFKFYFMCNICSQCLSQIKTYGHPCYIIMRSVCKAINSGAPLVFQEKYTDKDVCSEPLSGAIKWLESKGYLVTCEISEKDVAIYPNFYDALYNSELHELCWCQQPPFPVDKYL